MKGIDHPRNIFDRRLGDLKYIMVTYITIIICKPITFYFILKWVGRHTRKDMIHNDHIRGDNGVIPMEKMLENRLEDGS